MKRWLVELVEDVYAESVECRWMVGRGGEGVGGRVVEWRGE